ncbi:MAG: hypothetical protein Q8880_06130 [Bacteroidota bacterium]|nr:hypothetical protein [Bacteroidota bacterium]
MKEFRKYQSLLIVAVTIAIITLVSFVDKEFILGPFKIKKINLFSDILADNQANKANADSVYVDLNPPSDSALNKEDKGFYVATKYDTSNYNGVNNLNPLYDFFEALRNTELNGDKTRIAYFGDSMIEGDLITQTLRYALQSKFGGSGVGYVPITSQTSGFRRTIIQTFSNNWQTCSFVNKSCIGSLFGMSGYVFTPQTGNNPSDSIKYQNPSWVKYHGSNAYTNLSKFYTVKVYYGMSTKKNYIDYELDGQRYIKRIEGKNYVNELISSSDKPVSNVKINFYAHNPMNVYGVSFESPRGIFLDNFSFRGNSGLNLTSIPAKILKDFNNYFNYNLVVLQYGINVSNPNMRNFAWYEKGMIKVINHIKENIPNASILLISVGDRSYKNTNKYETDPSIPILIQTQKRIAIKTGIAFWNMFEAMGGYNSMVSWVDSIQPLANKDYTHVNFRGANRIANLLKTDILNEYNNFKISYHQSAKAHS